MGKTLLQVVLIANPYPRTNRHQIILSILFCKPVTAGVDIFNIIRSSTRVHMLPDDAVQL
jgi:hypothetical protein